MSNKKPEFGSMGASERERLTLRLAPAVKEELKRQAHLTGVSPSAYVAVLVNERKDRFREK